MTKEGILFLVMPRYSPLGDSIIIGVPQQVFEDFVPMALILKFLIASEETFQTLSNVYFYPLRPMALELFQDLPNMLPHTSSDRTPPSHKFFQPIRFTCAVRLVLPFANYIETMHEGRFVDGRSNLPGYSREMPWLHHYSKMLRIYVNIYGPINHDYMFMVIPDRNTTYFMFLRW